MFQLILIMGTFMALDPVIFAENIKETHDFSNEFGVSNAINGYESLASGLGGSGSGVWTGYESGSGQGVSGDPDLSIAKTAMYDNHNHAKREHAPHEDTNEDQLALAAKAKQDAEIAISSVNSKKSVVNALQQTVREAKNQIKAELKQLTALQHAAWAAQNSVGTARQQIDALISALNLAEHNFVVSERAAFKSLQEVAAQERHVSMVKLRAQQISHQLQSARFDLHRTEVLAKRVSSIAAHAADNVDRFSSQKA